MWNLGNDGVRKSVVSSVAGARIRAASNQILSANNVQALVMNFVGNEKKELQEAPLVGYNLPLPAKIRGSSERNTSTTSLEPQVPRCLVRRDVHPRERRDEDRDRSSSSV